MGGGMPPWRKWWCLTAGPCLESSPALHPHLAVHLRQELVQKLLPVLLLSTHLGHELLHHVVQLLCGGIKLDPAHFGCQSALVCFLHERTVWG